MATDEEVKKALEVLKELGYEIREYDQGYIACILNTSKTQPKEEDGSLKNKSWNSLNSLLTYVEHKCIIIMSNVSRREWRMVAIDKQSKLGRPIVGMRKDTRIGIRLDDETLNKLNDYCQKKGLSKSDVIRQALSNFLKW